MSVWFTIPSIRPLDQLEPVLEAWKKQGYHIALLRQGPATKLADLSIPTDRYLGWARSTNILAGEVLGMDSDCNFCVAGGDDYLPDSYHSAGEIEKQCIEHFGGTFGVMQPTGDNWSDSMGRIIERIAGSPWLGREWCLRAYEGAGPMPAYYHHNYADSELQDVALQQGVFWQRPDLCQYHNHWARKAGWDFSKAPDFARYINSQEYTEAQVIYFRRKATGFPGSAPLGAK